MMQHEPMRITYFLRSNKKHVCFWMSKFERFEIKKTNWMSNFGCFWRCQKIEENHHVSHLEAKSSKVKRKGWSLYRKTCGTEKLRPPKNGGLDQPGSDL